MESDLERPVSSNTHTRAHAHAHARRTARTHTSRPPHEAVMRKHPGLSPSAGAGAMRNAHAHAHGIGIGVRTRAWDWLGRAHLKLRRAERDEAVRPDAAPPPSLRPVPRANVSGHAWQPRPAGGSRLCFANRGNAPSQASSQQPSHCHVEGDACAPDSPHVLAVVGKACARAWWSPCDARELDWPIYNSTCDPIYLIRNVKDARPEGVHCSIWR